MTYYCGLRLQTTHIISESPLSFSRLSFNKLTPLSDHHIWNIRAQFRNYREFRSLCTLSPRIYRTRRENKVGGWNGTKREARDVMTPAPLSLGGASYTFAFTTPLLNHCRNQHPWDINKRCQDKNTPAKMMMPKHQYWKYAVGWNVHYKFLFWYLGNLGFLIKLGDNHFIIVLIVWLGKYIVRILSSYLKRFVAWS